MNKLSLSNIAKLIAVIFLVFYAVCLELDIRSSFTPTEAIDPVKISYIRPATESYAITSTNPNFNVEILVADGVTGKPVACASMRIENLEAPIDHRELVYYSANDQGVILANLEPGWYGTAFSCNEQVSPPFYPHLVYTGDIAISDEGEAFYFEGSHGFKPSDTGLLTVKMELTCPPPPFSEATPKAEVEIYGTPCP